LNARAGSWLGLGLGFGLGFGFGFGFGFGLRWGRVLQEWEQRRATLRDGLGERGRLTHGAAEHSLRLRGGERQDVLDHLPLDDADVVDELLAPRALRQQRAQVLALQRHLHLIRDLGCAREQVLDHHLPLFLTRLGREQRLELLLPALRSFHAGIDERVVGDINIRLDADDTRRTARGGQSGGRRRGVQRERGRAGREEQQDAQAYAHRLAN
jgi:hypothetical protein